MKAQKFTPLHLGLFLVPIWIMFADLSGTWDFQVQLDQGSGSATFDLKQDGEKLAGTYKGTFGEAPVSGTVKGDEFEFSFTVQGSTQVSYKGKMEGESLKGTCDYGGMAKGTFSAVRKKS